MFKAQAVEKTSDLIRKLTKFFVRFCFTATTYIAFALIESEKFVGLTKNIFMQSFLKTSEIQPKCYSLKLSILNAILIAVCDSIASEIEFFVFYLFLPVLM